jgi:hypothetical protein
MKNGLAESSADSRQKKNANILLFRERQNPNPGFFPPFFPSPS